MKKEGLPQLLCTRILHLAWVYKSFKLVLYFIRLGVFHRRETLSISQYLSQSVLFDFLLNSPGIFSITKNDETKDYWP